MAIDQNSTSRQMEETSLPPAIFLMGPTASGKTDLAMALSEALSCELISVDSALVYKGMDIGTAKPTSEELIRAPHRLIDIRDPAQPYSAANFREDALREMADITAKGKVPLLVGGTMLYFKSLRDGLAELPAADPQIREQLLAEANSAGWDQLHRRLMQVDPKAAERIKSTDTQRLQRALEVYHSTGRPLSDWHSEQKDDRLPYRVVNLAIAPKERSILHQRIEKRFKQMLAENFIDEVRGLYGRDDLDPSLPSIRAVGYRQVWGYLEGELSYEEMVEKGVVATRQLAKRQLTWLRSWPEVHWLDSLSADLVGDALKVVNTALK